ncbi:5-hydroxytryptamine receptor 3A-like [Eublepharis macularius]|uniref:5-hydroxytryptamine receptor 3A n=1 Tax=Eublepharis macularius TaxID=481883 RepID=A0AA97KDM2_EUBMA|nr:5-hydroxytryptamine receptor 3A-like [Eublepharis macularius]
MLWETLAPTLVRQARREGPPDALIIQLGENDLGRREGPELQRAMCADLDYLRGLFPRTFLLWSDLLQRCCWRFARNPEKVDGIRQRVARAMGRYISSAGGLLIPHPDISFRLEALFRPDGVHLSSWGHDIWLQDLRDGLLEWLRRRVFGLCLSSRPRPPAISTRLQARAPDLPGARFAAAGPEGGEGAVAGCRPARAGTAAANQFESPPSNRGPSQRVTSGPASSSKGTFLQLSNYLLTHYKKGVRPVKDWRTTTNVAIDVMIYAILSVDEKNQVLTTYIWYRQCWTDEFLKWDPGDFDNLTQMSIPTESIWVPDILINEFVDVGKSPDIPYVYIHHTGEVQNLKPVQVVTACSLDIYNFPFDVQNCSLTFTSWLHNIRDINISLWRSQEAVKNDKSVFMNQGEWELLHVLSYFREFRVDAASESYAEMKFFVVIRRRPLFYAVSLLLPSIFLMVMDIVGFYLPPDSGERVSFKITLLLGYSVFLIIVSDTLPATAIGTPLIGVYFVVCMALLVISLTETILIVRLVHKQDLQPHVPDWVKRWVLERAAVLLCIRDRNAFCPVRTQSSDMSRNVENNDSTAKLNHFSVESTRDYDGTASGSVIPAQGGDSLMVENILKEIRAIRQFLEKRDEFRDIAREWLQVGYVLDVLLFRAYLVSVLAYSLTLGTLWSIWQYA